MQKENTSKLIHGSSAQVYCTNLHAVSPATYRHTFVFEIFETEVSVKQAHHQQTSLIPECKSTHKLRLPFIARSTSINTYTYMNLTFRGPCIVMYLYNESQRDALFLRFI